ncbi:hypothetical protein, partial [Vibrio parahaemolyticus]
IGTSIVYLGLDAPDEIIVGSGFWLTAFAVDNLGAVTDVRLDYDSFKDLVQYNDRCLELSNSPNGEKTSELYFKGIKACEASLMIPESTQNGNKYPSSNRVVVEVVSKPKELTLLVDKVRVNNRGQKYGAIGDTFELKGYFDNEEVALDSASIVNGGKFATITTTDGKLYLNFIDGNVGGFEGAGQVGDVIIKGQYIDSLGDTFSASIVLENVGKLVERVTVHQYFPEPSDGATEPRELVNKTKTTIPQGWERQLFVTIEYSDGSIETNRDFEVGNLYSGISRRVAWEEVHGPVNNGKTILLHGDGKPAFPLLIQESDANTIVEGYIDEEDKCFYPSNLGYSATDRLPPGRLIAASQITCTGFSYSQKTEVLAVGQYQIIAIVNRTSSNYDQEVVASQVFTFDVVHLDNYKSATWGISETGKEEVLHGTLLKGDTADSGFNNFVWDNYNARLAWTKSSPKAAVLDNVCGVIYPDTTIPNTFGIPSYTFYMSFVNSPEFGNLLKKKLDKAYLGWDNAYVFWNYRVVTNGHMIAGIRSDGTFVNYFDASVPNNYLSARCMGCLSGKGYYEIYNINGYDERHTTCEE